MPDESPPNGWVWTSLYDVSTLGTGHTPSRSIARYWGGDVPWIGIRDAATHHGGTIHSTQQLITQAGLQNSSARLLPAGTVCLSRTASVGYVIQMARPMATSQDFVTWTCDPDCLDPRFLMYALIAEGDDIRRFGKGTTHTTIYFPEVKALHICLPPLAEQRRIVAKLDALTARTARARADLDRIPALAARYKQAVLAKAFSGELTAAWRQGRDLPAVAEGLAAIRQRRRADSKLGRRLSVSVVPTFAVPDGWSWISPDEVADDAPHSIGIGPFGSSLVQSDYRPHGVRLVFVRDIRRERFDDVGARYVTEEKANALLPHMVNGGEVLITKMGDPPGDTALYPIGAGPAVITADCVKIKPHAGLATARFLVLAIRSELIKSQLAEITAGVAQQKISLARFRDIALPIPSLEEQDEIVRRVDHAFTEIDRLAAEAAAARRLLDRLDQSLLTKAFRSELVPQDPADEPASVLIDRVRAERADGPKARRGRRAAA